MVNVRIVPRVSDAEPLEDARRTYDLAGAIWLAASGSQPRVPDRRLGDDQRRTVSVRIVPRVTPNCSWTLAARTTSAGAISPATSWA
jgi:hypothetical protein